MKTRAYACRAGHDTTAPGSRTDAGNCRECERVRSRNRERVAAAPAPKAPGIKTVAQILAVYENPQARALIRATDGSEPCRRSGPVAWFSPDYLERQQAAEACGHCHIRELCLDTIIQVPLAQRHGVWGGVDWGLR